MTSVKAVERFFAALDERQPPEPCGDVRSARHRDDAADAVLATYKLGREDSKE